MVQLRNAVVEAAWTMASLALYPMGLGEETTDVVGSGTADREASHVPILLVHGLAGNRSIFTVLRRGLRRQGFGHVTTMNYSVLTSDVRGAAEQLARRVEQVCASSGFDRIHVVGHSLGGLIARYYVQRLGGDRRVDTLFTLGTPHQGTSIARWFGGHPLLRQLQPDSDLVKELARPVPGCLTRFVAFYSDVDPIVPPAHARVEHPDLIARNVLIRGAFHNSLVNHGQVVREICGELTRTEQAPTLEAVA